MGLLPLVVDKLRQDSKLHDANMSKSTFGTKNVPAYSQFMFQYVYYCKQVYFQQEQSKLSGEIAFFSNLRKRGFQSGLRVHLKKGTANVLQDSDIMIDQIRAIDNRRLTKRIGVLPVELSELVKDNIQIVLDLDI